MSDEKCLAFSKLLCDWAAEEILCAPFLPKPRGMHGSTYHRIRARGEVADRIAFGQLRFPRGLQRRYQAAARSESPDR
jgi:hypothetical protein